MSYEACLEVRKDYSEYGNSIIGGRGAQIPDRRLAAPTSSVRGVVVGDEFLLQADPSRDKLILPRQVAA